jgi:uncharacterized membrane protein YeaQ/YmgE (transglycosylase-associated protein family)
MGIISWIIFGLFAGVVARLLLPGKQPIGLLWTMALGVGGAVVGGFVSTEVIDIADSDDLDFGSFLIAVGASVLLLALVGPFIARSREKEKDED